MRKSQDVIRKDRQRLWGLQENEDTMRGITYTQMTYAEIGKVMGLTPQRVHQLERQALWKLRHSGLAEYWRELKGQY